MLTRLIIEQNKVEGIGFMMMDDVQRFLDEVCDLFGKETRGECSMKGVLTVETLHQRNMTKDNGYAGT